MDKIHYTPRYEGCTGFYTPRSEGCNGFLIFFYNLVYLLNNVIANKIVGKYWVSPPSPLGPRGSGGKTQYFPPILLAIYHYLIDIQDVLDFNREIPPD